MTTPLSWLSLSYLTHSAHYVRASIARTLASTLHHAFTTSARRLMTAEKKKKKKKKKTPCDEKVEWSRRGVRRYVRREYRKVGRTHLSQKKERIRFRGGGAWACAFLHVPTSMHTTAPKHCKYRYCGGLCISVARLCVYQWQYAFGGYL